MLALAAAAALALSASTSAAWDGPVRGRAGEPELVRGTFSIVAADPGTGEVGVAVQSKYFAVGTVVPWARAGVGAVATQAAGVAAYGPRILDLMAAGLSPQQALDKALADDPEKETRQLGVVSASGETASFTGSKCNAWAGSAKGKGFTAQGNILAGEPVTKEMARAYESTPGSMAEKLMAAIEAGQAAGGDARGQQSAAMLVERRGAAKESREGVDKVVDLRVDDSPEPIKELRRLLGIHQRWDALRRASRHYQAKEWAKGIDVLTSALAKYPDDATILYDLACYESLGGRLDDAMKHLARSLQLEPGHVPMAQRDSDLDPLREREDFARSIAPAP
jgi:uncharacterized Ntn-hydrolase superfamily protein